MNGIKIDYEKEQEGQLPKKIKDYDNGYYLIKERLRNQKILVISIAGDMIHFHQDGNYHPGWNRQNKCGTEFFEYYEMIGKIKSMRITDIKLE